MAGEIVGLDCQIAYNTGTHASPTLVAISKAIDVELSLGSNQATFASRESNWEMNRVALKTLNITFGYEFEAGTDTVFDFLWNAYNTRTTDKYYVMDGPATVGSGSEGVRAYCMISDFSISQPLQDGVVVNVGLTLSRFEESAVLIEPDWHTMPAS